jgi:hypothetical protein
MSGKEKWPVELRADRLAREARERRQSRYELTREQEIDLLARVFAESVGHDLGFLCILPASADKGEPMDDAKPAVKSEKEKSDPPSLKPEEMAGWGKVTGHGC